MQLNLLRRMGNTGRVNKSSKASTKSVQPLAAAALLRKPGLQSILDSLAMYRKACTTGQVKLKPTEAFNHKLAERWLWPWASVFESQNILTHLCSMDPDEFYRSQTSFVLVFAILVLFFERKIRQVFGPLLKMIQGDEFLINLADNSSCR